MDPISITIPGDPQAQKRHRRGMVTTKSGLTFVNDYDPSKGDKHDFIWMIMNSRPPRPFDQPIRLDVQFYFSRPKSHYGTGSRKNVLKNSAPLWHTSKPDRDNLEKFVLDSMKGTFFRDDSIVCSGEVEKKYSDTPRIEIIITPL